LGIRAKGRHRLVADRQLRCCHQVELQPLILSELARSGTVLIME
jgi:hypothetical protein